MATAKQVSANRRNAALSRGPTTPKGKAVAAANPLKHGLRASGEVVIPGEDCVEYAAFAARMAAQLDPRGELEQVLTERLVGLAWRLRRVPRVETELLRWQYHEEVRTRASEEADACEYYVEDDEIGEQLVRQPRLQARALRRAWEATQAREEGTLLGRAFQRCGGGTDSLTLLGRYERALERSFLQCLHELQRLQAARSGLEAPLPAAVDVYVAGVGENGFVR